MQYSFKWVYHISNATDTGNFSFVIKFIFLWQTSLGLLLLFKIQDKKKGRISPHDLSLLIPFFSLLDTNTCAHIPTHRCQQSKKILIRIYDGKCTAYVTVPQMRQHSRHWDGAEYQQTVHRCLLDSKPTLQGGGPLQHTIHCAGMVAEGGGGTG